MRKENEGAHAQISLDIGKPVGRLHDAMGSQFRAVNERFDKLEKDGPPRHRYGQGPDLTPGGG